MKLSRGRRLSRKKGMVWSSMKWTVARGMGVTTVYHRFGKEMKKGRCIEATTAVYHRLGEEMEKARCKEVEGGFPIAEEATASSGASRLLRKEKASTASAYKAIPRLRANYEYGIIEPTFQGETAPIIGGGFPIAAEATMSSSGAGRRLGKEKASAASAYDRPATSTQAGRRLGKEKASAMAAYDRPVIPKSRANYKPTFHFQGETRIGEPIPHKETANYGWSCLVAYYPEIPKWPSDGKCGIIGPTFEGETLQIIGGPPIAEILEVGITTIGEKKIWGTIKVRCEKMDLLFFDRSGRNPQIVRGKDLLELTRPRVGLTVWLPLEIKATIDVGRVDMNETVDMRVSWEQCVDEYDNVKKESKCGRRGSLLHVSYVVYEKAVMACIEIMFEPRCPVKICGRITAHNNMLPDWESVLFCKKRSHGEHFRVERGEQQLPLLRSVATVPIYSTPTDLVPRDGICCTDEFDEAKLQDGCLQIDFDLTNFFDRGTIAHGNLKFLIKKYGDCISRIYSQYGVMQVKVSFVNPTDLLPRSRKR